MWDAVASLHRAAANQTQHNGDNGNNQQNVNQVAHAEAVEAEEAEGPDDDQNHRDDIQEISHGERMWLECGRERTTTPKYFFRLKMCFKGDLRFCTGLLLKGYN